MVQDVKAFEAKVISKKQGVQAQFTNNFEQ